MSTAVFAPRMFTSWGRVERHVQDVIHPHYRDELGQMLAGRGDRKLLAVGLGRSYGDSVLNHRGGLIDMTSLDRIIHLDTARGVLRAEAGLSLDAALGIIVPHGWFFATTPGTRFVTLGGAVANDVHGKNHHVAGTFGCSVRRLGLLRSDGSQHELARDPVSNLFRATIGGLGLTGLITWVEVDLVRIPSTILETERIAFPDIAAFFRLAAEAGDSHEHTVAWIDCASSGRALGRGIFQRANWSPSGKLERHNTRRRARMLFDAPSTLLNRWTVKGFNALYFRLHKARAAKSTSHYGSFFYPLDAIGDWNRLYGRRGFYQYQCVLPQAHAEAGVTELVRQVARRGAGSFLAVLKLLGPRPSPGMLSFPIAGATLALDFANRGQSTLELLADLDRIVVGAGGRLYPAKDGRMPAEVFRSGYAEHLVPFAAEVDPAFSSNFWRRMSA